MCTCTVLYLLGVYSTTHLKCPGPIKVHVLEPVFICSFYPIIHVSLNHLYHLVHVHVLYIHVHVHVHVQVAFNYFINPLIL